MLLRYMPPCDHSESLALTYNLSSSIFDNGHLKLTVFVGSVKADFLPAFLRLPPCFLIFFFMPIFDLTFGCVIFFYPQTNQTFVPQLMTM